MNKINFKNYKQEVCFVLLILLEFWIPGYIQFNKRNLKIEFSFPTFNFSAYLSTFVLGPNSYNCNTKSTLDTWAQSIVVFLSQAYLVFMTSIRVYLATCIILWWSYSKERHFPPESPDYYLHIFSKFHKKENCFVSKCFTFQLVLVFWHFDRKALCDAGQYEAFKDILSRYVPLGYTNTIKVIRI